MQLCKLLALLTFVVAIPINAQDCNCKTAFAWVKQTFEENDAGFQFVINRKGEQAYAIHNQLIAERIKTARNNQECADIITDWLHFFREVHLGVRVLRDDVVEESTNEIASNFLDWKRVDVDINEFIEMHSAGKEIICFEGIWLDFSGSFGIKKVDEQYIGFVIESRTEEWKSRQIRFRVFPDSVIYYMDDRSVRRFNRAELLSRNALVFDYDLNFSFQRYSEQEDRFLQSIHTGQPHLKRLNEHTLYLRIPSFSQRVLQDIDSLLLSNKDKITQTENLIIDLRINSGGTDEGWWFHLMPMIATNPVRIRNSYTLSTELTIQLKEQFGRMPWILDRLRDNLGNFVLRFDDRGRHYYEPFKSESGSYGIYPKQVGIIVDRYTASAAESFLLAARQSRRVKIFGHPTMGALDFSEILWTESPCGNFQLTYATSKLVDIDKFPIDGIGIQPDFFLGGIPGYRWVDFVNDILNHR